MDAEVKELPNLESFIEEDVTCQRQGFVCTKPAAWLAVWDLACACYSELLYCDDCAKTLMSVNSWGCGKCYTINGVILVSMTPWG